MRSFTMNSQSAFGDGVSSLYRENEADKPLTDIADANYVIAPKGGML